ncbi:MAG: CatB-related O-acetyltransferase [Flavobacterium sp.]|nr:MAG: CatB-related O-acetyltransferase [Flavobacterium sp.]
MKQILRRFIFNFFAKLIPQLHHLKYLIEGHLYDVDKDETVKLSAPFAITSSKIGKGTYISSNAFISLTTIGKYCSIGPNVMCGWGIHPANGLSTSPIFYSTKKQVGYSYSLEDKIEERKPIIIGNDVFIGMNVTILDGITIGDGAVIGAGSVVSKDIPPYAIAVGSPIQIKKYRFNEETIKKLLSVKWWDFEAEALKEVEKNFFDVESFLKKYNYK